MMNKLNEFILCVMDRENKTHKELEENYANAHKICNIDASDDNVNALLAAGTAFCHDEYKDEEDSKSTEDWIKVYFKESGEKIEDYEKYLKKGLN